MDVTYSFDYQITILLLIWIKTAITLQLLLLHVKEGHLGPRELVNSPPKTATTPRARKTSVVIRGRIQKLKNLTS